MLALRLLRVPAMLLLVLFSTSNMAANFTVNNILDFPDQTIDGICAIALGGCSLRAAIQEANATSAADTIQFSIRGIQPFWTIPVLGTPLPVITQPVTIDATTQPGWSGSPVIEIEDAAPLTSASALVVNADSSLIRGLAINGFGSGAAIEVNGSFVTVDSSYLGLDPLGNPAGNRNRKGILVTGDHVTIGGTASNRGNVIADNTSAGVELDGTLNGGSAFNQFATVINNFIGLAPSGNESLPNGSGVLVFSSANTIGGTGSNDGNVISGNVGAGVVIFGGASGNKVYGNFIGTTANGQGALGNAHGVVIRLGSNLNQVGAGQLNAGNVISGNRDNGVVIQDPGTDNNTVAGNLIGLAANGNDPLGNGGWGVIIKTAASNNTIGGVAGGARNIISGQCCKAGVQVGLGGVVEGNKILGNYIGLNEVGSSAVSNVEGVVLRSSGLNIVGDGTVLGRNVISGNVLSGVHVLSQSPGRVDGNFIGLDDDGRVSVPNGGSGILVNSSAGVSIAGNWISGNAGHGVSVNSVTAEMISGVQILNNNIGVDIMGDPMGNGGDGVFFETGATDTSVRLNRLFNNGGNGITLPEGLRNDFSGNAAGNNIGIAVDLGDDGVTANDPDDGDTGANQLQNYPDIFAADYFVGQNRLAVGYSVDSAPGNTAYPIRICFAITDADHEEPAAEFGCAILLARPTNQGNDLFSTTSVPAGSWVVGQVTDADGNSSEWGGSMQVVIHGLDLVFADGFEGP